VAAVAKAAATAAAGTVTTAAEAVGRAAVAAGAVGKVRAAAAAMAVVAGAMAADGRVSRHSRNSRCCRHTQRIGFRCHHRHISHRSRIGCCPRTRCCRGWVAKLVAAAAAGRVAVAAAAVGEVGAAAVATAAAAVAAVAAALGSVESCLQHHHQDAS